MEAVAGANSMTATNVGKFYLRFNDGILHRFYAPKFCLKGLAIGKRYMNFEESIRVEDIVNIKHIMLFIDNIVFTLL